jgi:tRNA/tmRNA/rRNA uracil-C5-methylase (TrmA/RlmC/RlmD family)
VVQGCAGDWAKKYRQRWMKPLFSNGTADNYSFQILLVDPPRSGLDENVVEMMKIGPFEHALNISCGINALQRDLEDLNQEFQVVQSLVVDLFPRTYSVETLVHLQRRRNRNSS